MECAYNICDKSKGGSLMKSFLLGTQIFGGSFLPKPLLLWKFPGKGASSNPNTEKSQGEGSKVSETIKITKKAWVKHIKRKNGEK